MTDLLLVLVVILIIVLIWRGPTMLPRLGEAFGKTVKGFRDNLPGAGGDASADATTGTSSADAADPPDPTARP